jgi:hypothetical protein
MSALGQLQTFALLNHFVGAKQERLQGRQAERPGGGQHPLSCLRFLRGYGFKGMRRGSHIGVAVSKREFDLRPSTADNIGKSTA